MESQFQDKFQKLFESLANKAVLRGNAVLVEVMEEPEIKTASGLIIAADSNQVKGGVNNTRPKIGLVLAVGEGYYDSKTGNTIPLDIPVGAVVMLPRYSLVEMSTFPGLPGITGNKLGLVNENEINFYYENMRAYKTARDILN